MVMCIIHQFIFCSLYNKVLSTPNKLEGCYVLKTLLLKTACNFLGTTLFIICVGQSAFLLKYDSLKNIENKRQEFLYSCHN